MLKIATFILFLGYHSPDFKFTATHKAYMDTSDSTKVFKDWEKCNIPVFLDLKNKNLVMYEEFLHIYNLLDLKEKVDDDKRVILVFEAEERGNTCMIEFVHYKATDKDQLYIRWRNYHVAYQLEKQ